MVFTEVFTHFNKIVAKPPVLKCLKLLSSHSKKFQHIKPKMYLNLSNGVKLPAIGLGTSGVPDESQMEKAIDAALEAGYRHIDTAFWYKNEKVIGGVLQKWLKSGKLKREDLFITTKLPSLGVHPDRVETYIKKSLANLQLEYADLYLIHFPVGFKRLDENGVVFEPKTDHVAVWKKMEEQVEAGRAKSIGLSNYNIAQIETILKSAKIKPSCLQIEVHVYLQQRNLIDFCHKNGIAVVAFSPLGSPGYNERMSRAFPNHFKEKPLMNIFENSTLQKIAQKHSKKTVQVALRFLLQLGIGAIPKSVTPQRIRDNFNVFDFSLDDEDMATLLALEIGEGARVTVFDFIKGIEDHPDYPFPKL